MSKELVRREWAARYFDGQETAAETKGWHDVVVVVTVVVTKRIICSACPLCKVMYCTIRTCPVHL